MNFIFKLLKFKNSTIDVIYDLILIIIDRLIKYSHIISFKKTLIVEQLNFVVFDKLIKYHKILTNVINDRNKFFTSNY